MYLQSCKIIAPSFPVTGSRPLLLALALMALFTGMLCAEEPFAFDKTPGQLPKAIVPHHYAIRIEADVDQVRFQGRETIDLEALQPVGEIVLNSLGLEIRSAMLEGATPSALKVQLDPARQALTLGLEGELPAGRYRLVLEFTGKLEESPQGIYITRYQSGGLEKRALATQMEPTDARRMFPCWDEPVFRATFELTTILAAGLHAVSNMPVAEEHALEDGRHETRFASSPAMSTYLLALFASEWEQLHDEVDGVQLRILTTPGKCAQARMALS